MRYLVTLVKRCYVVVDAKSRPEAYRKVSKMNESQVVKESTCTDDFKIDNIREVK